MKAWVISHGIGMRQALRRIARHPLASLFEVTVFGIALALPLGLHVAVENVQALAARYPAEPEISVFMALSASRAETAAVELRLKRHPDIDRVMFVPRAEALVDLRKNAALAEVLDALPTNPLPDAFTVRLKSPDATLLQRMRSELSGWPQVALAQVDSEWARKIEAAVALGRATVTLLGALLSLAVLAITFNTVRLQMLNQHDEIELSRLIGATNQDIRRPFLYFGALQGICGGGAALGIVALGIALLNRSLAEFSDAYGASAYLAPFSGSTGLTVIAFAAALGSCAAWLSAGRHLWVGNRD